MRQIVIPVVFAGALPARPPAHHTRRSLNGETMGTTWRVDVYAASDHSDEQLRRAVSDELDRLVAQMSHWREDSDLSRFNHSLEGHWIELPSELFTVLQAAVQVAEETHGAFDATIGPLVDAWGFGPGNRVYAPPDPRAIEAGTRRCGSLRVGLDQAQRRVLQPGGVSFDLSSIAKGFAVDRISHILDVPGISSCLVEIGGELRARGVKPKGEPWWVVVETAPDVEDFPETLIALCNLSVASSGDYRRYFEHAGRRFTHTVDPRTGWPVRHEIASVTVVHDACMLADAYSTALAVLGPDEGIAFADRHGLAAQFVMRNGRGCQLQTSRAFQQMLDC